MKKIIINLSVLYMLTCNYATAQVLFKKDYDTSLNGKFGLGELSSGTLIMELTRGLNRLDQNGNISFRKIFDYASGGILTINNFLKIENNKIYFDGVCYGICGPQAAVAVMDTDANVLSAHYYSLTGRCTNFTQGSCSTSDNGFASTGTRDISGNPNVLNHAFIIRSDSSGNLMWAKYFTNPSGGGGFVKQTLDSGFIVGFNFDSCGATVAKLNSSGNVEWCKSYIRPRALISDGCVNNDGTFMLCGLTDSSSSGKLFFMKVDGNGSILWTKGFDGPNPFHFILGLPHLTRTSDGNIALVASKLSEVYNYSSLVMLKVNTNGDTLWTNAIGGPYYSVYQMNIYNTSDNGFLVSGTIDGNLPMTTGMYFLYRTDSLFNTSCVNYREPILEVPLFPTDSDVVLTSIDGGAVFTANIAYLNLTATPTYDDCLYTIANSTSSQGNVSVHPNPTTGILTLEVQGPLMSDCYFSVYDHTGRLVFQRTLYTEKEKIEVDLSPYGKGLYLVEFTEKEQVSVKKVVVE
jgi:hypothetical protein